LYSAAMPPDLFASVFEFILYDRFVPRKSPGRATTLLRNTVLQSE
jgi:hypothetical protein